MPNPVKSFSVTWHPKHGAWAVLTVFKEGHMPTIVPRGGLEEFAARSLALAAPGAEAANEIAVPEKQPERVLAITANDIGDVIFDVFPTEILPPSQRLKLAGEIWDALERRALGRLAAGADDGAPDARSGPSSFAS